MYNKKGHQVYTRVLQLSFDWLMTSNLSELNYKYISAVSGLFSSTNIPLKSIVTLEILLLSNSPNNWYFIAT